MSFRNELLDVYGAAAAKVRPECAAVEIDSDAESDFDPEREREQRTRAETRAAQP